MRKGYFNRILYFIVNISGVFVVLSIFIPAFSSYQDIFLPILILCSLILPLTGNTSIILKILGGTGIIFYITASIMPDLFILRSIAILITAFLIVKSSIFKRKEKTEESNYPDFPLPGPAEGKSPVIINLRYLFTILLSLLNPFQLIQFIFTVLGGVVPLLRYKEDLPSPENYNQKIQYRLPFSGRWLVYNGGVTEVDSHSWEQANQRYAYDFVVVDDKKRRHRRGGRDLEDYYCYGEPVLAPADGQIVMVRDGVREHRKPGTMSIDFLARDFRGNFVIIKHAENEYSFLAHFIPGSIKVKKGEQVVQGQKIAECGNSGHSTEPHLHFQIQDRPNFYLAASLPVKFSNLSIDGEHYQEAYIKRGQEVERE